MKPFALILFTSRMNATNISVLKLLLEMIFLNAKLGCELKYPQFITVRKKNPNLKLYITEVLWISIFYLRQWVYFYVLACDIGLCVLGKDGKFFLRSGHNNKVLCHTCSSQSLSVIAGISEEAFHQLPISFIRHGHSEKCRNRNLFISKILKSRNRFKEHSLGHFHSRLVFMCLYRVFISSHE